jgi:hypothetical protein
MAERANGLRRAKPADADALARLIDLAGEGVPVSGRRKRRLDHAALASRSSSPCWPVSKWLPAQAAPCLHRPTGDEFAFDRQHQFGGEIRHFDRPFSAGRIRTPVWSEIPADREISREFTLGCAQHTAPRR